MTPATPEETMTVVAARALAGRTTCFVGIGLPSAAANLARRLHAPGIVLIYESGTIGAKPTRLPLSIGDGELAETADSVVPMPEIFAYWLQAGRVDVGFLGAAQIDRFANLNSTVIGDYDTPRVRLPGAGGAPEISAAARETFVMMRHRRESFVAALDFITSVGFMQGGDERARAGFSGGGPSRVITDLCMLAPDPVTRELFVMALHPGVRLADVRDATGWPLKVAPAVTETAPVTDEELATLRALTAASAP